MRAEGSRVEMKSVRERGRRARRTGDIARIASILTTRIKQHHLPILASSVVLDVVNRQGLFAGSAHGDVGWSKRAGEGGLVFEVRDKGVFRHAGFADTHDLSTERSA